MPLRRRRLGLAPPPLQLSRGAARAALPVARPWSPSLHHGPLRDRGLEPPFDGLPVLRDHLTSAGSSSSVLRVLGTTARAEPGRSPWVRPVIFVATSSPIHPRRGRISGFAAASRLTRRGCLTALRSRSIQPRTYDFHQTSPRGLLGVLSPSKDLVLQADALVSSVSGSLRRAPGVGSRKDGRSSSGNSGRSSKA